MFQTGVVPLFCHVCHVCVLPEPVFVSVDEKLSVLLSKTGGLESLEVQGTMSLIVGSDADAYVAVQVCGEGGGC